MDEAAAREACVVPPPSQRSPRVSDTFYNLPEEAPQPPPLCSESEAVSHSELERGRGRRDVANAHMPPSSGAPNSLMTTACPERFSATFDRAASPPSPETNTDTNTTCLAIFAIFLS